MQFKLTSSEDFQIVTKEGGTITVPSSATDETLPLLSDIPSPNYVMRVNPQTGDIYYTTPDNA